MARSCCNAAVIPASGPFPVAPRTLGKPQPSARSGNAWKRPASWPRSPAFLGVYTNPRHIVAYSDGEIRQQYETTYVGRPASGQPTVNEEADAVRFVNPADLDAYDIHPSMRQQIGDYLAGTYPPLG